MSKHDFFGGGLDAVTPSGTEEIDVRPGLAIPLGGTPPSRNPLRNLSTITKSCRRACVCAQPATRAHSNPSPRAAMHLRSIGA